MKRFISAALLATVAVGGAFAGNANKLLMTAEYKTATSCVPANTQNSCAPSGNIRCTIVTNGQPSYQLGSSCTVPLFRN